MREPMRGLFLPSRSRFSSMNIGIMFWISPFLTTWLMALPLAADDKEDAPESPASSSISGESEVAPRPVGILISLHAKIWKASWFPDLIISR